MSFKSRLRSRYAGSSLEIQEKAGVLAFVTPVLVAALPIVLVMDFQGAMSSLPSASLSSG